MANYYTQFSEVLTRLTDEEEIWLRQQLAYIFVFGDAEYTEDELPGDLDSRNADWSGYRLWRGVEDADPDVLELDYEFRDDSPDEWGRHLWIFTEETGDPATVAYLVQQFLQRFRPEECWSLTYACTCSTPRVGDFGGGAVFVTADEMNWSDAWGLVDEQQRLFDDHHRK